MCLGSIASAISLRGFERVCVCVGNHQEPWSFVHSQFADAHSPLTSVKSPNGVCQSLGLGLVYGTFKRLNHAHPLKK